MKNRRCNLPPTLLILVLLLISSCLKASDGNGTTSLFKGNLSGTFNPFNPKLTAQVELPIRQRSSYGIALNYYFVNWTGPMVEPLLRFYGRRHGNAEGSFFQLKMIYGNLSTLDFKEYNGALKNERWNTFGCGLAYGYKFKASEHFTIEPLGGFRFLTPPYYRYYPYIDESIYASITEGVIWYVSSGFPLDVQVKLGYQF